MKISDMFRSLSFSVPFLSALSLSVVCNAAALDIPDKPLFQTSTGVSPNLILTLDDSASMMRGWIPQSLVTDQSFSQRTIDGPKFKVSYFNGLYYDPRIKYEIPIRSDKSETYYTTSFTDAYFNGFNTSKGTENLETGYRVVGLSENSDSLSTCESHTYLTPSNWYGERDCRFARHGKLEGLFKVDNKACSLNFLPLSGDDRISVNTSSSCNNLFRDMPVGTEVTIAGISNASPDLNGLYLVNKADDDWIEVGDPDPSIYKGDADITWNNDGWHSNAKVSFKFSQMTDLNTNGTHAYYYYYFDEAGLPQPDTCDTPDKEDDGCYVRIEVGSSQDITAGTSAQQKQNFANWYSFYRNRGLVAMSGAISSIASLDEGAVRLTWQGLLKCIGFDDTCPDTDGNMLSSELKIFDKEHAEDFFDWVSRMNITGGSTPLPQALIAAGDFVGNTDAYWEKPGDDAGEIYSCRRNFHIMFTDGLWNKWKDTPGSVEDLDSDSAGFSLPSNSAYPTITSYSSRAPYRDVNTGLSYTNKNSLADIALYYWGTDLNTSSDLDNNLTPYIVEVDKNKEVEFWNPRNNPATWQHLVNFPIGLGLSKSLTKYCYVESADLVADANNPNPGCPIWADYTFGGDFDKIASGERNWPEIGSGDMTNNEPDGRIYDLWHMAVNSRGKFYSADNPEELIQSFQDAIDTIVAIASAGGGSALGSNDNRLDEYPIAFHATFRPDWSGQFSAKLIESSGQLSTDDPYWEAGSLLPAGFDRNIFTLDDGGYGIEFRPDDICGTSGTLVTALNKDATGTVDNLCAPRVQYLRGDVFLESAVCLFDNGKAYGVFELKESNNTFSTDDQVVVTGVKEASDLSSSYFNGTFTVTDAAASSFTAELAGATSCGDVLPGSGGKVRFAQFRERSTPLGDIIGSDPVYMKAEDFGYGSGSSGVTGKDSYSAHIAAKEAMTPTIYVGANDGMLHAFQADTNQPNSGHELFAYVPRGVYGNLSALTDPAYTHRYYVDGKIDIHDVYTGTGWTSILVGALGAGGRSIYALDLHNPFEVDEAENFAIWEFQHADLGLTFGKPRIAATGALQWSVIFGNGINSDNGEAALFVVDLMAGTLSSKVMTGVAGGNGLSAPFLYDDNQDRIVDRVYAGDILGNLWRFDNNGTGWSLGNGGNPLFTGTDQPISAAPFATPHPNGGVLVYFGTGRYLTAADLTNSDPQSFYAIWDNDRNDTVTRDQLYPRELVDHDNNGEDIRTIQPTSSAPDELLWFDATGAPDGKKGWYFDLPHTVGQPAERSVTSPFIFTPPFENAISTLEIVTQEVQSDPCSFGGSSFSLALDPISGDAASSPVFDLDGNRVFDDSDLYNGEVVVGRRLSSLVLAPPTAVIVTDDINGDGIDDQLAYLLFPGTDATISQELRDVPPPPDTPPPGGGIERVYWRQIR